MKRLDVARVEAAIRAAEARTSGELRVAVARFFLGRDVRAAAEKTFERLRMDRTKHRNAVLIFVAPLGRRCSVVADSAAQERIAPEVWRAAVDELLARFRGGDFTAGLEAGIQHLGDHLAAAFPAQPGDVNELPDSVVR